MPTVRLSSSAGLQCLPYLSSTPKINYHRDTMLIQHGIGRIDIIMHQAKRMKVLDPLENPVVVLSKRIIDLLTTTGQELILVQVSRIEVPGQGSLYRLKQRPVARPLSSRSNIRMWMSAKHFTHFKLALNIGPQL
ncbi:hypothetical protein N7536_012576 [Penicillium majusculum]|uniref:Uncharacterized protein n=1 Tax=Penicillium solitum TaxID=60172 RepID=A0A1V6QVX5_9EURO|nr:uncharacterized protein PENSOL_c033G06295 [Penicillium solitum]KAJ5676404.1 hypothetical protein N7536_012576 [Penicillium majusculum]OQD93354.1 hypothetical protein PENSOL_c033G06295 [Penicillium solitum]